MCMTVSASSSTITTRLPASSGKGTVPLPGALSAVCPDVIDTILLFGILTSGACQSAMDKLSNGGGWPRAGCARNLTATVKQCHRRDRSDTEPGADLRQRLGVQLGDQQAAGF